MEFKRNDELQYIKILFPTLITEGSLKISKEGKKYKYIVNIGEKKKFFRVTKAIWDIGDTSHCPLFKKLKSSFDKLGVFPDMGENGPETNFLLFLENINDENDLEGVFDEWDRENKKAEKEAKEEKKGLEPKRSYFKSIGQWEDFEDEDINKAAELISNNEFFDYCLDIIDKIVIAQRERVSLVLATSLSSILPRPLHAIASAGSGAGKTKICASVKNIFPKQRVIEINSKSTSSSLTRVQEYEEGEEFFKHRVTYIGDVGNQVEKKAENVTDLLTTIKILMSDGKYNKTVAEKQGENYVTVNLRLDGFGSAIIETTDSGVFDQFDDRSYIFRPANSQDKSTKIREYQLDDKKRFESHIEFEKRRKVCAAGIEEIFSTVEKFTDKDWIFNIYNPFADEMLNGIFDPNQNIKGRKIAQTEALPNAIAVAGLFSHQLYYKKIFGTNVVIAVVTPEDFLFTLENLGESIAYALSDIDENIQTYIEYIENNYLNLKDKEGESVFKYSYEEIKLGQNGALHTIEEGNEQEDFSIWINDIPMLTSQISEELKVSSETALKYLKMLEKYKFVCQIGNKKKFNEYVPVRRAEWNKCKKDIQLYYPTHEELYDESYIEKIESIYDEYIRKEIMGNKYKPYSWSD